jgi:hypothetical protein
MRRAFLLVALAWGALVVLIVAVALAFGDDADDARLVAAFGALLLGPVAIPLALLRSRWYRPVTLLCACVAVVAHLALSLAGTFLLLPSALIVLASILTPPPQSS